MHNGNIQLMRGVEVFRIITEFFKPRGQGIQIFEIVIGFNTGIHDFFL